MRQRELSEKLMLEKWRQQTCDVCFAPNFSLFKKKKKAVSVNHNKVKCNKMSYT